MIAPASTLRIATFCKSPRNFLSKFNLRYLSTSATVRSAVERRVPYGRTLKEETPQSKGPTKPVPKCADVVVMGGGSIGCHTLYHLAKKGITNVVLLERDQLTAGTTWHTAGLLWQLRPNDIEIELLRYTREIVSKDLEEETGLHTGWIENGGLFIASNKQRLDEYKRLMSLGKVYGIESHVLSPAETKDLYPLMKVGDLYGTLYVPTDGTMDPAGTCSTLARAATARGALVIENCPVTGIQVKVDDFGVRRVTGVETEYGTIQTACAINCAGVWARALGVMAGVNVPLIAMRHAYVVTERIEGIQNMPNVRDHDASVYLRLQGDALSVGGYEPNPNFWEEISDKFAFSLFDLDWDVFTQLIEGAINRIPALERTGVKSTVCGPEAFTADHKPLMGEAPELRGFYLGCGFNSAGMMLGGGCGKELADWVIDGRPEKDMYSYDIRRFHHSMTNDNRWIRERSHESYAKNYSVVFPHDEALAGRNMRLDPLHQEILQQGCVFQERHGWERPGWFNPEGPVPVLDYDYYGAYGNKRHENYSYNQLLRDEYTFDFPPHHDKIKFECVTCRNTAAVFDMSYFGKFYLVGPDAKKAADWLFSADVSTSIDYQLTVTICLSSRSVLQEVLDTDLSNETFPFSTHQIVEAAGHKVRAMRLSFVGEMGWELHVPEKSCVPVHRAVMRAGAKFGIANAGYRAIDSLSIEKGYRHWHADLRSDDTPLEAGLAFTCKLKSKIPFLGREALEKQKAEGLFKRLVCFTIDEKVPMFGLEVIWRNGKLVGHIRRADFAFTLNKTIAYGYIRDTEGGVVTPDYVRNGEYSLERMGVSYPAKAHLKSPFDPNNKRVKGIY
ncbi:sarcosine dehydrogenase, mitochondrial-like [Heptranchias perlo]|uniref:sarcosine dehydrogenase, mitochondrial-like n=1 Tax=Heptranchias perlo TaxID=212740 RepID=UPI003559A157